MNELAEIISEFNPWWSEKFTFSYQFREIFNIIEPYLDLRQIICITGLRRTGKTTLLKKIIRDLIEKNVKPEDILYFSYDLFAYTSIRDVFREFLRIFNHSPREKKLWVFLDEIQRAKNWDLDIKYLYDLYPKLKIVISGSSSINILKNIRESLAGRFFNFELKPLSFYEFLKFKKINFKPIEINRSLLEKEYELYLHCQGFPEMINIENREIIKKYLEESILGQIFYKDIPFIFSIKRPDILYKLYILIMRNPGQIVVPTNIAEDIGATRQLISKYLYFLEQSFLIKGLVNFSRHSRKVERKKKKYYPMIVPTSYCYEPNHLIRSILFEWQIITREIDSRYYWRSTSDKEVDLVIYNEDKNEIIPIEIKFGKISTKSMKAFMRSFKLTKGYILSWNLDKIIRLEENESTSEIIVIPLFKYILNNRE